MIELKFKVTTDSGETRDLFVRIHEPFPNPPEKKYPWAVTVEVDGRRYTLHGEDPLDAIEEGSRHAAILLRGLHGDALDPPLEPRMTEEK